MRYRDWTARLGNTIKAATERPFSWGETDCCMFVADCCVAVCGTDPAANYRGTYDSEIGAKRALIKHGCVEDAMDAHFRRIDSRLAQRGDVALYESDDGRTMAVRWANDWWATAEAGVRRVNCSPSIVWRVE
ncbi:DUF6950 family protein [Azorhizophilus paspali]|uniref:DUF6950 family protein n=1 Tax=Azorhizophilus paspali TaxID=69963 RepID=A0ABV6SMI0_AZOPA